MKILLIDDEIEIVKSFEYVLKIIGHKCEIFTNPIEALKAYKRNQYDLVVTDFKMPEMNGIELMKIVKSHNRDAYIILITGCASVNSTNEALNLGAYAIFMKPFDLKAMVDKINEVESELAKLNDKKCAAIHKINSKRALHNCQNKSKNLYAGSSLTSL